MIAEKIQVSLGRAVIVENKAGAAGIIADLASKMAAPDGNTDPEDAARHHGGLPAFRFEARLRSVQGLRASGPCRCLPARFGGGEKVPARITAEYVKPAKSGGSYSNFASAAAASALTTSAQPHGDDAKWGPVIEASGVKAD